MYCANISGCANSTPKQRRLSLVGLMLKARTTATDTSFKRFERWGKKDHSVAPSISFRQQQVVREQFQGEGEGVRL